MVLSFDAARSPGLGGSGDTWQRRIVPAQIVHAVLHEPEFGFHRLPPFNGIDRRRAIMARRLLAWA
jgi:hypothetical protein